MCNVCRTWGCVPAPVKSSHVPVQVKSFSLVTDPVCTSTEQVETEKFGHFGGSWITVAWPQHLIVFSCISMPVGSSVLATTSKPCLRDEGSKMHPAQRAKKPPRVWKQLLQHIVCAYSAWENSLGCWEGGMAQGCHHSWSQQCTEI